LSQLKRVLITMSDNLLEEIDSLAKKERKSRSEIVREVMKVYIAKKQKSYVAENLALGYQEMAQINLELAEMCFDADNETNQQYEEKLAECE
jgi:CopG family transcriptional regulator/antitoxin EndoAI